MAKKFYVVWQGREKGIFTTWAECKKQVDHFPGARYKSFPTLDAAESAFKGTKNTSSQKSPTKKRSTTNTVKTYTASEINALAIDIKIFTDGGCEPNPGKAGSGIALYRNNKLDALWYGLYSPKGTNNTAELNALHQALILTQDEIKKDTTLPILTVQTYQ